MACKKRTFELIRPYPAWLVSKSGPLGFSCLDDEICEQGPPLAEASSFSRVNKSSLNFSPPALRRGLHRRAGKFPGRGRRWLTPDGCAGS
jgi:hypothetical protein